MCSEILSPEQCYKADALSVAHGITINTLIDNAGRAVATEIVRRYGARPTVVVCGPGNNGKDGKAAADYLHRWGWPVRVSDDVTGAELIIDALYGAGLSRDFPQSIADSINNTGVPVVAIDVPSGLDGLTGRPRGACIRADLTVTFFRKKPAHLLLPGRDLCGHVVVADIGIPDDVLAEIKPAVFENAKPTLPQARSGDHKYRKGHAVIVSGDAQHTGASRLAAQAALKVGAGLVTLAGDAGALAVHANHVTTVMLAEAVDALSLARLLVDDRKNAVCIGPAAGLGVETQGKVRVVLESAADCVLDADALTSFQQNPSELFELIQQRAPTAATVLTPHEGEFNRLFKSLPGELDSKVERTKVAAKVSGAIVLLKGADTVIASPDGHVIINSNAPPSLATAGSGDVLAGLITGLLAQGMPAFKAAAGAAWIHGATAAALPQRGVTAETLVAQLKLDE